MLEWHTAAAVCKKCVREKSNREISSGVQSSDATPNELVGCIPFGIQEMMHARTLRKLQIIYDMIQHYWRQIRIATLFKALLDHKRSQKDHSEYVALFRGSFMWFEHDAGKCQQRHKEPLNMNLNQARAVEATQKGSPLQKYEEGENNVASKTFYDMYTNRREKGTDKGQVLRSQNAWDGDGFACFCAVVAHRTSTGKKKQVGHGKDLEGHTPQQEKFQDSQSMNCNRSIKDERKLTFAQLEQMMYSALMQHEN